MRNFSICAGLQSIPASGSQASGITSGRTACPYCIRNGDGKVTKVLVKRSEFDRWMRHRWRDNINIEEIVGSVMQELGNE